MLEKNKEYINWVKDLKQKISKAQIKASLSVNTEMIKLYLDLGKSISEKINHTNWGNFVVEQLSKDLNKSYSGIKGFSRRNLFYMKKVYEFYNNSSEKVQQLVAQIPWGHNLLITTKIKNASEAIFYIHETLNNNWSRSVLEYQIETNLYKRQAKAINNFSNVLPKKDSDLANSLLKDPYNFDFISLSEKSKEKNLRKFE